MTQAVTGEDRCGGWASTRHACANDTRACGAACTVLTSVRYCSADCAKIIMQLRQPPACDAYVLGSQQSAQTAMGHTQAVASGVGTRDIRDRAL